MEQITLDVPSNLAEKFYALSNEEKKDAVSIISAWLNLQSDAEKKRQKNTVKMLKFMSEISRKAEARGLTDEMLQEILNEV